MSQIDLLQKPLHEDSEEKAKWREFPKFYGFKATTNTIQYILDHTVNKHKNSEKMT